MPRRSQRARPPEAQEPGIILEMVDGRRVATSSLRVERKQENLLRTSPLLARLTRNSTAHAIFERPAEYILIYSSSEGPRSVGLSEVKGLALGLGG